MQMTEEMWSECLCCELSRLHKLASPSISRWALWRRGPLLKPPLLFSFIKEIHPCNWSFKRERMPFPSVSLLRTDEGSCNGHMLKAPSLNSFFPHESELCSICVPFCCTLTSISHPAHLWLLCQLMVTEKPLKSQRPHWCTAAETWDPTASNDLHSV